MLAICTQRPLLFSHPFPSLFSSFSTLPHSYLMVLLWCLPPPCFFLLLLLCLKCLFQSPRWPDGGAADQNVPVPRRQSDQCGLEPRWQTLRHRRTEGAVLSMCKWTDVCRVILRHWLGVKGGGGGGAPYLSHDGFIAVVKCCADTWTAHCGGSYLFSSREPNEPKRFFLYLVVLRRCGWIYRYICKCFEYITV